MTVSKIDNPRLKKLLEKDGPFPLLRQEEDFEVVYSVELVDFTTVSLNGPRILLIHALGLARTTGYEQPTLQPAVYVAPPQDGIWDFVFVAKPPQEIASETLTPISASFPWNLKDFELKGVRIHSATKTLEQKIQKDNHREIKIDNLPYTPYEKAA